MMKTNEEIIFGVIDRTYRLNDAEKRLVRVGKYDEIKWLQSDSELIKDTIKEAREGYIERAKIQEFIDDNRPKTVLGSADFLAELERVRVSAVIYILGKLEKLINGK